MPSTAKEWDEDPWAESPKATAGGSGAHYTSTYSPVRSGKPAAGRPLYSTIPITAPAVREALSQVVRDELNAVFQKIMDRLDELEDALKERD